MRNTHNLLSDRPGRGRPCDYQAKFMQQARELPPNERKRHAQVCTSNGCTHPVDAWPSFTCACADVMQEMGE